MSPDQLRAAAQRLEDAERTRIPCRMFSLEFPDLKIADAYAIQRAWIDMKLAQGRTIKGRKIGLTSKAMQRSVGIDEPDYGVLLDDMFFRDGAIIPTDRFISLRIEAELAFILKTPLSGPDCTLFDVLNATDYVMPALEILDTRIQRVDPETKRTRTVIDTISDNAADAGIVLGGRPFRPDAAGVDLRRVSAAVSRNGEIEETGLAAGVLNHPAYGVAWLANRLAAYDVSLQPGEVILSGSFIRPIDARKGDTFVADYGEFGTVSCHFG